MTDPRTALAELVAATDANRRAKTVMEIEQAAEQFTKALAAAREALDAQPNTPDALAEAFIQAAISNAPEPLRRLGEFLTRVPVVVEAVISDAWLKK